jgi:hypothetical protein
MHTVVRGLCLILCLGLTIGAAAQEKKIEKKDLPAPVLTAFQKAYPKATIKGASTEVENGKTYYEIESLDGTVKRDLLYLADGTITEIEESIALSDLPAPVKAALDKKYPKAKISKSEKVTKGAVVAYEVVVISGKTTVEASFDPSGKLLKESKSSGKKEGKEEEGEKEEKD